MQCEIEVTSNSHQTLVNVWRGGFSFVAVGWTFRPLVSHSMSGTLILGLFYFLLLQFPALPGKLILGFQNTRNSVSECSIFKILWELGACPQSRLAEHAHSALVRHLAAPTMSRAVRYLTELLKTLHMAPTIGF